MLEIIPQEVTDFSVTHAPEKFHILEVAGARFGEFYVTPDHVTLGWPGQLDFSTLHKEALHYLPSLIRKYADGSRLRRRNNEHVQDVALASFILADDELVQCDLTTPEGDHQYADLRETPDKLVFARYDITRGTGEMFLDFAFTAVNAKLTDPSRHELTIRLPRDQQWPDKMLSWVVEHHDYAYLMQGQAGEAALQSVIGHLSHLEYAS